MAWVGVYTYRETEGVASVYTQVRRQMGRKDSMTFFHQSLALARGIDLEREGGKRIKMRAQTMEVSE